ALGAQPGGGALTAPVTSLTHSDRRLSSKPGREIYKRLIVNPGGPRKQSGISREILLGSHIEQKRCAGCSNDAGEFVE
ncbi:hypothetical protein PZ895_19235, partial [Mesorhizobium sp. YIM 152430]|uniref:hypothetical protein n=1 Tax=Mesorhizobium sp. YIM 152430 TaxID=3031761 RepID=UPI0023D9F459